MDNFLWLQRWFSAQCDGTWEQAGGIELHTVDNPGWALRIYLTGTKLDAMPLGRVAMERSEQDWYQLSRTEEWFEAACGPTNLDEVLAFFRSWAGTE